jgi:hypothetical protein
MSRVGPVIQDLGHNLGLGALITALAGGGELSPARPSPRR